MTDGETAVYVALLKAMRQQVQSDLEGDENFKEVHEQYDVGDVTKALTRADGMLGELIAGLV
jgi:hypothetical protein